MGIVYTAAPPIAYQPAQPMMVPATSVAVPEKKKSHAVGISSLTGAATVGTASGLGMFSLLHRKIAHLSPDQIKTMFLQELEKPADKMDASVKMLNKEQRDALKNLPTEQIMKYMKTGFRAIGITAGLLGAVVGALIGAIAGKIYKSSQEN